jgi:hypothetical protein
MGADVAKPNPVSAHTNAYEFKWESFVVFFSTLEFETFVAEIVAWYIPRSTLI